MWGGGFVHGLGGASSQWGGLGGRLPPPKAELSGIGAGDEPLQSELHSSKKWQFPVKAGLTSGGLALLGDTAAQVVSRYQRSKALISSSTSTAPMRILDDKTFWEHDWIRASRMASYGFLLYGPLSHSWYQLLDHLMPVKNLGTFSLKVVLNQVVLGPIVVSIVFGWNALWTGTLDELPDQYRFRAFPTLVDGWKFWTPVSFLNFGVVPLPARVTFMSACAVFWNFYLSTVVSKKKEATT